MPLTCFKCKCEVANSKHLLLHLRVLHHINHTSNYFRCCEEGCGRTFSLIRTFRRHLIEHDKECHPSGSCNPSTCPAEEEQVLRTVVEADVEADVEDDDNVNEYWDDLDNKGISERVGLYIANLRARANFTCTSMKFVVNQTGELISDIVGNLAEKTMTLINKLGGANSPEAISLKNEFETCSRPFKNLETDYKQMEYFSNSSAFVPPIEENLPGVSYVQRRERHTGSVRQVSVQDTFMRISLLALLHHVLTTPGVMKTILSWQQRKVDALQDFFDGDYCISHPLFLKEISIPLLLYNDDCETVNPLGSKTGTHKLGFLYFTIKSLPAELMSSLKSVFLLAVYKSDDAKTYGLDAILRPIVEELKILEVEGLAINCPDFHGVVKFTIGQVLGDNLGLNSILGYIESFSGYHACRWCRVDRDVLKGLTLEDSSLLRNALTHERDLTIGNATQTGLKRDSFLNRLNFYHVTDNFAPDIMHDILEGIGPLEVKLILASLINQGHITIDKLNYRITSFDYGFSDRQNKPSVIGKNDLKNADTCMHQSAAQMWCLLRMLPLLLGDLVPEDCKEWELLLLLLSIMEIVFSPSLTRPVTAYLRQIIEEHHALFLELYPALHLRPKHHFMIHYPTAIEKIGPLVQYWTMRFEAKHNYFKTISHITCNFRNICKTMAFRHQMTQCYHFLSGTMFEQNLEVGPGNTELLANIDMAEDIVDSLACPLFTEAFVPSWVIVNGTNYRPGMSVFLSYNSEGEPNFGLLKLILVMHQPTPKVKLVVECWETICFDRHLFAYTVRHSQKKAAVDVNELLDHHPLHAIHSYRQDDPNLYISLRYRLF